MLDKSVFCPNCGNRIAGNANFCMSCGYKLAPGALPPFQSIPYGKEKAKRNTALVITLIVSAVIIVALGITLGIVISNNNDDSGSHVFYANDDDDDDKQKNRDRGEQRDDDGDIQRDDDDDLQRDDDNDLQWDDDNDLQWDDDNFEEDSDTGEEDRWEQAASDNHVSYGTANITIDNEECVGDAYYSYSEDYGHMFAFTYEDENGGLMITVALPEKKCVSGKTFSKQDLNSSNCLAELIMIVDEQSEVINSSDNPDSFHSITFTLDEVSVYESARFTFEGEITSLGTRFELKGQAAAYYEETSNTVEYQDSQSGGWDSQQGQTTETCAVCHGTGVCQICDGKGLASYTIGGQPVTCTSCSGSCQCKYCWGTGYIWK